MPGMAKERASAYDARGERPGEPSGLGPRLFSLLMGRLDMSGHGRTLGAGSREREEDVDGPLPRSTDAETDECNLEGVDDLDGPRDMGRGCSRFPFCLRGFF